MPLGRAMCHPLQVQIGEPRCLLRWRRVEAAWLKPLATASAPAAVSRDKRRGSVLIDMQTTHLFCRGGVVCGWPRRASLSGSQLSKLIYNRVELAKAGRLNRVGVQPNIINFVLIIKLLVLEQIYLSPKSLDHCLLFFHGFY